MSRRDELLKKIELKEDKIKRLQSTILRYKADLLQLESKGSKKPKKSVQTSKKAKNDVETVDFLENENSLETSNNQENETQDSKGGWFDGWK